MKKLLPQANSLSTVIDVFIYVSSMEKWVLEDVASFCKFEVRQSSYYINACYYLGLLNKDSSLSEKGKEVLEKPTKIKESVYEMVISDPLISKIFAKMAIEGEKELKAFTVGLLRQEYPEYSDAVIERRTSTLLNWCNEIKGYIKKHL